MDHPPGRLLHSLAAAAPLAVIAAFGWLESKFLLIAAAGWLAYGVLRPNHAAVWRTRLA